MVPIVFNTHTGGEDLVNANANWLTYTFGVFQSSFIILIIPGVLLGSLFPYLLKFFERSNEQAGLILGKITSINTLGGIIGSVSAGFLLLPLMGVSKSITLCSILYLALALLTAIKLKHKKFSIGITSLIFLLLLFHNDFQTIKLRKGEELLDYWEGKSANVAVIKEKDNIKLKVNNIYSLGDSRDFNRQRIQGTLPLLIHSKTEEVFFLGMGTGITAGSVLSFEPTPNITVTELLPEVIKASKRHYKPWLNGLFENKKVAIYQADGRNYLKGYPKKYDVIIADLFLPWNRGTGNLYSIDHYKTASNRLEDNGIYVQWLPAYQMTKKEYDIIAKTFTESFQMVTLWQATFFSDLPTLALIGHDSADKLNIDNLLNNIKSLYGFDLPSKDSAKALYLMYYLGNLTENSQLHKSAIINSDDYPIIEFNAPKTHRDERSWFNNEQYIDYIESIEFEADPFLSKLTKRELGYIKSGKRLTRLNHLKSHTPKSDEILRLKDELRSNLPPDLRPLFQ